jgi:hypothetical protein
LENSRAFLLSSISTEQKFNPHAEETKGTETNLSATISKEEPDASNIDQDWVMLNDQDLKDLPHETLVIQSIHPRPETFPVFMKAPACHDLSSPLTMYRTILAKGDFFLKIGRFGKPHIRKICLNFSLNRFEWWNEESTSLIGFVCTSELLHAVCGRKTPGFEKIDRKLYKTRIKNYSSTKLFDLERVSMSIIFSSRMLEIEAKDEHLRNTWYDAIKTIISDAEKKI